MWWIIGLIIFACIVTKLAQSKDMVSKIMLFTIFLLVLSLFISRQFTFMVFVTEISSVILLGTFVIKVFQLIFLR